MTDTSFFQIGPEALGEGARIPLATRGDAGEVFYELALDMLRVIEENHARGRRTVMIVPVGPVGQYPIFVRLVSARGTSLRDCWFFNMDEYLGDDGRWIDEGSPLSFRGFMRRALYGRLDPALAPPEEQRVFPDPRDPGRVTRLLAELGGADLAVGGIGINGHLAFNEARDDLTADEFARLTTRTLDISPETRAVNAIGDLSGAIDAMPRRAATVGMAEILGAKQIRLGAFRDWHRAVVRQAAYGEVSAHFPVTLCQRHPDARIYLSENAARRPF